MGIKSGVTTPPPHGAALVEAVIAHVRSGKSAIEIIEPVPASIRGLPNLTLAGHPAPPSLRKWLAFDGTWLPKQRGSLDGPSPSGTGLDAKPVAKLAEDLWGNAKAITECFADLHLTIAGRGILLDWAPSIFRFLYLGRADLEGEYPVLYLTLDEVPRLGLAYPGFDVWLATRTGLLSEEDARTIYASSYTEHRMRNLEGIHQFEYTGSWQAADGSGESSDDSDEENTGAEDEEDDDSAKEESPEDAEPKAPTSKVSPRKAAPDTKRFARMLLEAVEQGDRPLVRSLLETSGKLSAQVSGALLEAAVVADDTEILDALLAAGADPNARGTYGFALATAARSGKTLAVSKLLQAGAEVDCIDTKGRGVTASSALHDAASDGHLAVAKLLLEAGANPNAESGVQRTPLHEATTNPALVELLITHGADPQKQDKVGQTPLHLAVEARALPAAKLLIAAGALLDARNAAGDTPLHLAFKGRDETMLRFLVGAGASRNIENHDGLSLAELVGDTGQFHDDVAIQYRGDRAPQQLEIKLSVTSWEKGASAKSVPAEVGLVLRSFTDGITAGAAGSDAFPPTSGTAKVGTEHAGKRSSSSVSRTASTWNLEVAGVAPAYLVSLVQNLSKPRGPYRVYRISITGSAPVDDSPLSLTTKRLREATPEFWLPKPWPNLPFTVERHDPLSQRRLRVCFERPPSREIQAELGTLVTQRWPELLASLPDDHGEPAHPLRMLDVRPIREGSRDVITFAVELAVLVPTQTKHDFPFLREPAIALLVNLLARFHEERAKLASVAVLF